LHHVGSVLVSVITPSFNQAGFIRETIESVLSQDYRNLEYIVVDGGSTDGTVDILRWYAARDPRFRFVSEPDQGQSDAINKGLRMANGSIIGWLNSDDTYLPGAIGKAVQAFLSRPDWAVVYGRAVFTDETSRHLHEYPVEPFSHEALFRFCFISQPAAFIRRDVFLEVGGVDVGLKFCMDYDLWIRISKRFPLGYIPELLATTRYHPASKTATQWYTVGIAEVNHTQLKHYGAISEIFMSESWKAYGDRTPWILFNGAKEHGAFGVTPQVTSMNRHHDLWVPPRFRITIRQDRSNPLAYLIIKGSHAIPSVAPRLKGSLRLTVHADGRRIARRVERRGEFTLIVPVTSSRDEAVVELTASRRIRPSRLRINKDRRLLSFIVYEVVAASEKEYMFYQILQNDPAAASGWMVANKR
jgi:GT2 family glycosyltransferase